MYHRPNRPVRCHRPALLVTGLVTLITFGTAANAYASEPAASNPADPVEAEIDRKTFLEQVTVTATRSELAVMDAPGEVSVVTSDDIEDLLLQDIADLVKFEPGVYVDHEVGRLGLNGFNIRGLGGNRVLTQVDGVRGAEQFDFGPLNVHQQSLDVDVLQSAEIVRSAGSALYGSDALGGVISLQTKDPSDFLGGAPRSVSAKVGFDGRSDESSINLAAAASGQRTSGSLFLSAADGSELDNQGEIGGAGADRTQPNPQTRESFQLLGKIVRDADSGSRLRGAVEYARSTAETNALSARGATPFGPFTVITDSVDADDEQERTRLSLDQTLIERAGMDLWTWQIYGQDTMTDQFTTESRATVGFGPARPTLLDAIIEFEQQTLGANARTQTAMELGSEGNLLFTFGASYSLDEFDMLRDRTEIDRATGAPVFSILPFPTKYFPRSDVQEIGAYAQAAFRWSRLTLVPGVRYDQFELDVDEQDRIFLDSGGLPPTGFDDSAVSPKLGVVAQLTRNLNLTAQYAAGFRAPPFGAVNTGFTNLSLGYLTLPNPALDPETSDNFELGLRGTTGPVSWSVNGFRNDYDDFIELVVVGFDPRLGVLEFQNVNLTAVEIEGIEIRAESKIGDNFLVRLSYADIEGNDVSDGQDVPLSSVAPSEGILGLRYFADSGRWSVDAALRAIRSRDADELPVGDFAPPSAEVVDVVGTFQLPGSLVLRAGVLNATDETYFEWGSVRGRSADDTGIDFFSSPGRSLVATLGWNW